MELQGEGARQVKGVQVTCLKQNIEEKGFFPMWKLEMSFPINLKFYKSDV